MTVQQFLIDNNIPFTEYQHPAVFTCEEAEQLVPLMEGARTKNLFVRDRKGKNHYLVVVDSATSVDLAALSEQLNCSRLSLASAERLTTHLGITPGAVSLLALYHDRNDKSVQVVIDRAIAEADSITCHPMVNTSTLSLSTVAMRKFLSLTGHTPLICEIPQLMSKSP